MSQQTQKEQILSALKSGQKITPIDALNEFGCFRLGARIYDLKEAGHQIDKAMVEVPSGKRVAEYSYISGPKNTNSPHKAA